MKILEIWGNGSNVIIKFKKGIGGIWWTASKWLNSNCNFTDDMLIKKGYRRLKWKD
jgi:hypothetical protein